MMRLPDVSNVFAACIRHHAAGHQLTLHGVVFDILVVRPGGLTAEPESSGCGFFIAALHHAPTIVSHSSSVSTATPCLVASLSFEPAPGPATT